MCVHSHAINHEIPLFFSAVRTLIQDQDGTHRSGVSAREVVDGSGSPRFARSRPNGWVLVPWRVDAGLDGGWKVDGKCFFLTKQLLSFQFPVINCTCCRLVSHFFVLGNWLALCFSNWEGWGWTQESQRLNCHGSIRERDEDPTLIISSSQIQSHHLEFFWHYFPLPSFHYETD